MNAVRQVLIAGAALLSVWPVFAHHSYSMFDATKSITINGTVAKVEWQNPHIFIWAYVADKSQPDGYARYLFESGAVSLLVRQGWTKDTLKIGEKVAFEYLPLKDGRGGGALIKATHVDGTVSIGDPQMLRVLNAIAAGVPGATQPKGEAK